MKQEIRKNVPIAISMIIPFLVWTVALRYVDVQPIGPQGSAVGFAAINQFVHKLTGVNMHLYVITDWLGIIPICFMFGFAFLGLFQWINRKHISYVDFSIRALGVLYFVVIAMYFLFEVIIINYRPVLINGVLEASYPSSTTMLVMTVMPTSMIQLNSRIKNTVIKRASSWIITVFIVFMICGRLIAGVHWFTDIVGGALFSTALVLVYREVIRSEDIN